MKIKRISIYNTFECTGADCSVNCCRGWKIPVDADAYRTFHKTKGLFGVILRHCTTKKDGITAFRSIFGRCPFWGTDRLCIIQKKHDTSCLPLICIQFPRQHFHLGAFCEETLYLACPEAARLFLLEVQQGHPLTFEELQGEVSYPPNTTNDDAAFLEELLQARAELLQMLRDGRCRYDSLAVLNYARDAQNACLSQSTLPRPSDYHNSTAEYLTMDCDSFDILLFGDFYHARLRITAPLLYKLCQKYLREFGTPERRSPSAADVKLARRKEHLRTLLPNVDKMLNCYFEYYLQTDFLNIFEDYSFIKHLLYGIAKTNMLCLFLSLYAKNKKRLTLEETANMIAVFERRAPQMMRTLKDLPVNFSDGCSAVP